MHTKTSIASKLTKVKAGDLAERDDLLLPGLAAVTRRIIH